MTRCSRKGCTKRAHSRPVLLLRARGAPVPARASLSLVVCKQHRDESTPASFFSNEGWRQLCEHFTAKGFAEPQRDLTQLTWEAP